MIIDFDEIGGSLKGFLRGPIAIAFDISDSLELVAMVLGDAHVAQERLDAEAAMDLSSELQGARSSYFEALEEEEDVDKKKFT